MYLWTSARLLFLDHSTEVLIWPFVLVLLQCAKDLFHGIKTVTLRGNFNFGNMDEHLDALTQRNGTKQSKKKRQASSWWQLWLH